MYDILTFEQVRPLIDWNGNECCGFIISRSLPTVAIWPVPSLKPSEDSYSIGHKAWQEAQTRAKREGYVILGTIHTHPNGPEGPSEKDLEIASHLRNSEIRMVWHPLSSVLTIYDKSGIIQTNHVEVPRWFKEEARLIFLD